MRPIKCHRCGEWASPQFGCAYCTVAPSMPSPVVEWAAWLAFVVLAVGLVFTALYLNT